MNYKEIWNKYHNYIIVGAATFIVGVLAVSAVVVSGKPTITDPPNSTKESFVTLNGKAAPQAGIAVFDQQGRSIFITQTNDQGEFTLANLPVNEGENKYYIRTVKKNWRASLATIVIVKKDTTAPALEIGKFENSSVAGSNTAISGKAEPGSTVTVNGVQASVNSDGTWSATVSLQPGANKVTVAATDPAGNVTTNIQTITYTPSAVGSQTGTVNTTTSTVNYSAGSLPPTASSSNLGPYFLDQNNPTGTIPVGDPTANEPPKTTVTEPAKPAESINVVTWVSNDAPNARANETIYTRVRDNFGRPVTGASVVARVSFKSGTVTYSLHHIGNGEYSVSFKLYDKYSPGYRVSVEAQATYLGFSATDYTAFTNQ